jgi:phosphate transport system protein
MDITSDTHSQHISRQFNQELEELKTHLMTMGGLVEQQVQQAIQALLDGDSRLAEQVSDGDRQVNEMQLTIDATACAAWWRCATSASTCAGCCATP